MKDYKKARKAIDDFNSWEVGEYELVGHFKTIRKALEKQIAKEPKWIEGRNIFKEGEECPYCMDCGEELNEDYPYCPDCGQKIDWTEQI